MLSLCILMMYLAFGKVPESIVSLQKKQKK